MSTNVMAPPPAILERVEVKVRESCGTYIARANGKTASCTVDAAHAVRALAVKLWWEDCRYGLVCKGTDPKTGAQIWILGRNA